MGYIADEEILCYTSFVIPVGCWFLQGGETDGGLRDAGQLLATTHCCCCSNSVALGEHSPPEPEPGWLWGCCDLHPPLQRLSLQSMQAKCETQLENHLSILYSDVLSLLPTGSVLTQKEKPGRYSLRKGATTTPEFFWKVDAQVP